MADHLLHYLCGRYRGIEIDVDVHIAIPQQVSEILGGDIAGRARCERTTAQPPIDESRRVTPDCTAAYALAKPDPRVLWKCAPSGASPMIDLTAAIRFATRRGVAVPMVSARA